VSNPINSILLLVICFAAGFGIAALYSPKAIRWLVLRLNARAAGLDAYHAEYRRVIANE
jgi:disulfide bond formation protein DsbB